MSWGLFWADATWDLSLKQRAEHSEWEWPAEAQGQQQLQGPVGGTGLSSLWSPRWVCVNVEDGVQVCIRVSVRGSVDSIGTGGCEDLCR